MPKQKRSFTLIELMIVVIIIGIMAGIAIPWFIRTAEKVRGDEAVTNLRLIFAGEKMYRLDNNIYGANLVTGGGPLDGGLSPEYIEDMTTDAKQRYFTFTLGTDAPHQTFTATATRKGSGIYGGRTIQIKETELWSGDWPWVPYPRE